MYDLLQARAALEDAGFRVTKLTTKNKRKLGINRNGVILWRGPSIFDGVEIVVIATGLTNRTANDKTGDEIQTWILFVSMHPSEAIKTGADVSICGDCKHRPQSLDVAKGKTLPKRSCYVRMDAPASVWKCFNRGGYAHIDDYPRAHDLMGDRMRRIGSYGDPAAVPLSVWKMYVGSWDDTKRTGYTHQWRNSPELKPYVMASVDTEAEYWEARELGWRTFRIKGEDDAMLRGEFGCPASEEQDKRLNCDTCGACDGNPKNKSMAGSPVIIVHGVGKKYFAVITN